MTHEKIPMVDLQATHRALRGELDEAIAAVVDTCDFIQGKAVAAFSRELEEWLGIAHVVTCGNGTDALTAALMALNLKPGDEVITPAFSFVAAAEAIALLGLKPVFADIDPVTFTLSPWSVQAHQTARTRAILPVHLFGQAADMQSLMPLAGVNNWFVVEDNAQSMGAKTLLNGEWRALGGIGDVGCTSFFPSKILGTMGDGGALFARDEAMALELQQIVHHGSTKKYVHHRLGFNSRLDTLQAAVLRVKLRQLDGAISARRAVAGWYDEALHQIPGITTPRCGVGNTHVYHQYTLRVHAGQRDALRAHLERQGIASMVYYPAPLHGQRAFGEQKRSLPQAELAALEVLSLPMHPHLDISQIDRIAFEINQFMKK